MALAAIGGVTISVLPAPVSRIVSAANPRPAPPPLPGVTAPAFAVSYDGQLIAGEKVTELRPTASTIKVLTALAVLDGGPPLSQRIKVTPADALAAREGALLGHGVLPLVAGETLTVRDLLLSMLLPSADNAADLLASEFPGGESELLHRMTSIATRLHLGLPPMGDPSGLSPFDRLSPLGEVRLGWAALKNPTLAAMVGSQAATLSQGQRVQSINRLLSTYRGAIGIKTGQTAPAGYVLLFAAHRTGTAVGVIMGEPTDADRFRDAGRLLDWTFAWAKAHTWPAGSIIGSVVWPGGAVQELRTAAPLLVTRSSGLPQLHLKSPATLALGGCAGYAAADGHRVAVVTSPAPLFIRLWTLVDRWPLRASFGG